MELTPFELSELRVIGLFANLVEMSAVQKLLVMSDECFAGYSDISLPSGVRAQAVADAREINSIFQEMGNMRERQGISG